MSCACAHIERKVTLIRKKYKMAVSPRSKIIFLTSALEQPRIVKRITDSSFTYEQVEVYTFVRSIYNVKNSSRLDSLDNVKCFKIGRFEDGKYLKRILLYFRMLLILYKKYGFRQKKLHVFGFDLRVLSFFIIAGKVTYEISDIMWLYMKNPVKLIISKIDFLLTRLSEKVIFTSEGYYLSYYSFLDKKKIKVIENKFKTYGIVNPVEVILKDKVRIAYIGAFRYEKIIKILLKVCSKYPGNVILNFYGNGPKEIVSEINTASKVCPTIRFNGPFKNPEDLEDIYSQNNINFVAYDNNSDNEKVAMPNKFYESGYFNIPIVCSKDTYVGQRVLSLGMGWEINPTEDEIEQFIRNIKIDEIDKIHNNIKKLNKEKFESKNV